MNTNPSNLVQPVKVNGDIFNDVKVRTRIKNAGYDYSKLVYVPFCVVRSIPSTTFNSILFSE